jgi:UTP--glucose-1-phosphate uridylyltransferase
MKDSLYTDAVQLEIAAGANLTDRQHQAGHTPNIVKDLPVVREAQQGLKAAAAKMQADGLPLPVIRNFERLFDDVLLGKTGVITEEEIEPVRDVTHFSEIQACGATVADGERLLRSLVVVRLNGGLGTSMGLQRAKSLLPVKNGLTFNDIIAQQLRALQKKAGVAIPLVHMTSFSTDADVRAAMRSYQDLSPEGLPASFLQHRHPKIYLDTMMPANEQIEELNWNPPGHGDIYAALIASGLAERLVRMGKRYAFVANADNLGATVEPAILGYFARSGAPFLMETAERTAADAKGGHLARRKTSGRLLLRESSQAPTQPGGDIIPEFQDISKYRHFNTNNIWLDLEAVLNVARQHDGAIPLPLISNKKNVNPRDRSSRKVIQIETAMGAAIEVFEGALALQVPRRRFAPVKTNNDLLVVRSDAYVLNDDYTLTVSPKRRSQALPLVSLDPQYYGLIKDFEERIEAIPSLVDAESLTVSGDIIFDHPVRIVGKVRLAALGSQKVIPAGTTQLENCEVSLASE